MLTAQAIREKMKQGEIIIRPFVEENLQPNSYDLTLAETILYMPNQVLSVKRLPTTIQLIPNSIGMIELHGGQCYLATHQEYIEAPNLIMTLHGRSTLARYFLSIHETAGFGDLGYHGHWTLELYPKMDITLFVGMRIAQIAFIRPVHSSTFLRTNVDRYKGKYVSETPVPKLPQPNNF